MREPNTPNDDDPLDRYGDLTDTRQVAINQCVRYRLADEDADVWEMVEGIPSRREGDFSGGNISDVRNYFPEIIDAVEEAVRSGALDLPPLPAPAADKHPDPDADSSDFGDTGKTTLTPYFSPNDDSDDTGADADGGEAPGPEGTPTPAPTPDDAADTLAHYADAIEGTAWDDLTGGGRGKLTLKQQISLQQHARYLLNGVDADQTEMVAGIAIGRSSLSHVKTQPEFRDTLLDICAGDLDLPPLSALPTEAGVDSEDLSKLHPTLDGRAPERLADTTAADEAFDSPAGSGSGGRGGSAQPIGVHIDLPEPDDQPQVLIERGSTAYHLTDDDRVPFCQDSQVADDDTILWTDDPTVIEREATTPEAMHLCDDCRDAAPGETSVPMRALRAEILRASARVVGDTSRDLSDRMVGSFTEDDLKLILRAFDPACFDALDEGGPTDG